MDQWLDAARPPREGEGLDLEKLQPYLREHLPEVEQTLDIEQFPSGFSDLTYLLRSGDTELVLRRPPFGNRVKTAHDMGREYRLLAKLNAVYPLAPRAFLYCGDESVIGAPFYVMERRRGVILRKELPSGLGLSPVIAGRLSEAFIDNLAILHTLDYEAAGLADLGKPEGYVERQVSGWAKRYQRVQTDGWAELDQAAAWLHAYMPAKAGAASLVHNDYRYDNLMLDPADLTRIVAVLDWEICTLGDPLMDLGTTLACWTEAGDDKRWRAGFGPTSLPGSLTRRQVAEHYGRQTGFDVSNMTYYFCFGLFKLAVIVQQIYYRFFTGHTKDPRFAKLNEMVGLLGRVAAGAIERDSI